METKDKIVVRGELALVLAVLINSFAVAVTVYAGLGISPVSSFPYAVSLVFPFLTLGTWTCGAPNPARNEYDKREVIDLLNPIQVLSVLFRFGCLHRFSFQ